MEFDFDPKKSSSNKYKHGIDFEKIFSRSSEARIVQISRAI